MALPAVAGDRARANARRSDCLLGSRLGQLVSRRLRLGSFRRGNPRPSSLSSRLGTHPAMSKLVSLEPTIAEKSPESHPFIREVPPDGDLELPPPGPRFMETGLFSPVLLLGCCAVLVMLVLNVFRRE